MSHNTTSSVHMIFSSQTPEAEHEALSFYLEDNQWSRLLELVNEYGHVEIHKETNDKFLLTLGSHQFSVVREFNKAMVTMLNISTMTPGAAELLAKIADLLFFDRKRRFMISTPVIAHEQLAWTACQKLDIPVRPENAVQATRFQDWEAIYTEENKPKLMSFSQSIHQAGTPGNPNPGNPSNH